MQPIAAAPAGAPEQQAAEQQLTAQQLQQLQNPASLSILLLHATQAMQQTQQTIQLAFEQQQVQQQGAERLQELQTEQLLQLQSMQQQTAGSEQRAAARHANHDMLSEYPGKAAYGEPLVPLVTDTGVVPHHFPNTAADFIQLTPTQIMSLLQAYNCPVHSSPATNMRALWAYVGLPGSHLKFLPGHSTAHPPGSSVQIPSTALYVASTSAQPQADTF